jgi:CubicO group peptidase (beta-lactamase class C family)
MNAPRSKRLGLRVALSRRQALHAAGGGLSTLAGWGLDQRSGLAHPSTADWAAPRSAGTPVPTTGGSVRELAAIDAVMGDLMVRWQLPGGQVALAKDGRLVFDRGYGLADVERAEPVRPSSLFRIASVSKAITAVAVLTLLDAGQLALDEAVFPLLAFVPPAHATMNPRLASITV